MPVLTDADCECINDLGMKFTAETAVIAAKLSHAPTSARNRPPEPPKPVILPSAEQPQPAVDGYVLKTLTRTRKQLDRLFSLMGDETDPQKLDRLASAIARLAEQERQLSGRPLPGSLRPRQEKSRRAADVEPEV